MKLELRAINLIAAKDFFKEHKCGDFSFNPNDFSVCVIDENEIVRGVIAMYATGTDCSLAHLYTDGTALVGSILYGAAWRAAKALGYKQITI